MTEYRQFIQNITKQDKEYYLNLVKFTKEIILDIGMRKQHLVARDLKITPVKLSNILPVLKAML